VVIQVILDSLILVGRTRVVPGKAASRSKPTKIEADFLKTREELGSTNSEEIWAAAKTQRLAN
jgi:hypothetical protein